MPTGAPRVRLPRQERGQQLLDIAEDLFTTRGFANTSIEDIARGAGVTRPIVYDLHGNKEQVLLACVQRGRTRLQQEILAAVAGETEPRAQLRAGFDAYFRVLEQDPGRWELLFGPSGPIAGALGQELTRLRFSTVELVAGLLTVHAPHIARPQLEAWAHGMSGSAEQLGRWWRTRPELTRAQVVDFQVEHTWTGIERLAFGIGWGSQPEAG